MNSSNIGMGRNNSIASNIKHTNNNMCSRTSVSINGGNSNSGRATSTGRQRSNSITMMHHNRASNNNSSSNNSQDNSKWRKTRGPNPANTKRPGTRGKHRRHGPK